MSTERQKDGYKVSARSVQVLKVLGIIGAILMPGGLILLASYWIYKRIKK